jgi:histidinol-phosphate aminotransferase
MQQWFDSRGIGYIPSTGNFVTVRFGDASPQIYQGLLERGVIVRPVANYGMPDFLRISVGTEAQLERLFEAVEDLS